MSLLLKLKERFSNEQVETNNVINEHVEEIDSKTENKEKDIGKARVDIDIQALANALQYICNFNYSKKQYLYSKNPEVKKINLDKNIIIETIDTQISNYDPFAETIFPIIKLRIYIDDIKVKFLVLKRNINYKWEIEFQNNMFPMSHGVINFINKWSEVQLNKERKKEQEKLNRLIEIYKEYEEHEK